MFVFRGVDGVDVLLLMELSHSSKMARVLLQIERYVMKYCHAISSTLICVPAISSWSFVFIFDKHRIFGNDLD